MILKASQRGGPRHLAAHLLNDRDNDHVTVQELRGFVSDDLHGAMAEAAAIARGTRCRQPVFSLSLNPPKGADVPLETFAAVADRAESALGLTGQPRALVIHEKEGRRHAHVVWSRIDAQTMTAINMPFFKTRLNALSKDIYLEYGWDLPDGHRANGWKNPLNFTLAEWQQAKRLDTDPREIKQVFQSAWARSDNTASFANALEEHGYYLAKGDRRGMVAVDIHGEVFSVARWAGVKTKAVTERLGHAETLPGVDQVRIEIKRRLTVRLRAALIGFIGFVVVPILNYFRMNKVKMGRVSAPALADAQIDAMFDQKQGDVTYQGHGQVHLFDEKRSGFNLATMMVKFKLVRNIAAMTHREREALRFYLLMNNRGWIDDVASDRIHLGLVYGDGKAAIGSYDYSIPAAATRRYGVNNQADAIRWYVREFGTGTENAISELMTIFDGLRQTHPDDPLIRRISAVIASGNRWFTESDLPGSAFGAPGRRQGLFLGFLMPECKPVAWYGEGSLVSVAPPGAGKTQGHVIPNLLLWRGPAIVLDVKSELWTATSAWRQKHVGPVYRFAPFEPDRSHGFNPLSAIRSDPQFLWEDAALAAGMMVVLQGTKEPFFEQSAQRTLTMIAAGICRWSVRPQDRAMSRVLDIASGVGWDDFLTRAMLDVSFPPLVRAATAFYDMEERTRSNVLSQLQTSLKSWEGGRVARVTRHSDWTPAQFRDGTNPTLYICINPEEIEASLSILRVLIGQHVRALTRSLPDRDSQDVLFLLDEFPQLRHMPPVEEGIAVGRGYGLKFWLFAQSLGQIRTVYKNADSLLGQCGLRAFVNPSLQDGTAQKISDDLGYFDSVLDGTRQRVVEPQALGGPAFHGQQIVFTGAAKPLRLDVIRAHRMPTFRERFGEAHLSFSNGADHDTLTPRRARTA